LFGCFFIGSGPYRLFLIDILLRFFFRFDLFLSILSCHFSRFGYKQDFFCVNSVNFFCLLNIHYTATPGNSMTMKGSDYWPAGPR